MRHHKHPTGNLADQQDWRFAARHDLCSDRSHHQINQAAIPVRTHHQHVKFTGVCKFANGFTHMAYFLDAFGLDAVAREKLVNG